MSQKENNPIEFDFEEKPKKNHFFTFLFLLVLLILIIFGAGYYLLHHEVGKNAIDSLQNSLQPKTSQSVESSQKSTQNHKEYAKDEEIKRLQNALAQKEKELQSLSKSFGTTQTQTTATTTQLRYSIKPKKQIIAECFSMQIGKWEIPQGCLLSLATKISKELENDKKVVAFEVQGIVDSNPYKGLSPELKQEGLASFRAWNAIQEINKKLPNATAFEGPSLQSKDKRGYRIKAYFVE